MIVVVEGVTNAGKSTLIDGLANDLRDTGHKVELVSEAYGKDSLHLAIQKITRTEDASYELDAHSEALLYLIHLTRKVELLRRSFSKSPETVFLVDRLELSTIALFRDVRGVFKGSLDAMVDEILDGLPARYLIYLHVPVETVLQRAARSPLSRKDTGIETYFDAYTESERYEAKRRYAACLVLDSASLSPAELCARASSWLRLHR